ncbi:MAG TPA: aminodeoxychorismate synthase component I, partial [Abditibacteriaceae bacterium]|nr:aminodeoxychorismate synthase component I [Abditibacteriaceae bacterium]
MLPSRLVLDFNGRRLQGARPFAVFEAKNGAWTWQAEYSGFPFHNGRGDTFSEVQRALQWSRSHIGSQGAAIGFFSYDAARQIEPRAFGISPPTDDLQVPDARLVFYEKVEATNTQPPPHRTSSPPQRRLTSHSPLLTPRYLSAIARIQEYIAAGDIYQANFTQHFAAALPCPPDELYERLRATHPMPFSALLAWHDLAVISNSPERFLKLKNRRLSAQPIKGTIRRGRDDEEDEQLKLALQNSEKDRAENVMIVDLLRNDLGRVCEWGSVRVPSLFEVQTFPSLHHLVSTVTGTLRDGLDGVDALRAAFPCGSITGAPKIRAMQIIDELEPVRRGVAMGAIGYFGFDGDMEWNVAIRTITCKNNRAYYHVGGGIVADSVAEHEYAEMLLKARALEGVLHALQVAPR